MKEDGEAAFFVPNGFFWERRGVWQKMEKFRLYPKGVVALPSGAVTGSGIPFNIVIVGRQPKGKLFAAQLSASAQIDAIIENFLAHRAGKKHALGRLIDPGNFVSWAALELDDEIEQLAQRSGMNATRFGDVIMQIETTRDESGFDGDDEQGEPNAVYLPRYGQLEALTNLNGVDCKHSSLVRLEVDPGHVVAEFLAQFFNSEFGRKLRARWARGQVIKAIPVSDLEEQTIYLPDLAVQEKVLRTQRHICDLRMQLDRLEHKLMMRPAGVSEIHKQVERLNRDEGVKAWIETLPFPLASVLWRYHASDDPRTKQDLLVNVFEVLAEFLATIMLSAFHNDEAYFQERRDYWLGVDEGYGHALRKSDFGNWRSMAERLAKDTRRMLSGGDCERCLELYRAHSTSWVEALTNKRIYAALEEVNRYRNNWIGHTSTVTLDRVFKQRVRRLENQLALVQEALGDVLNEVDLLRPGQMRYDNGVFYHRVERLKGSRTIFQQREAETTVPMEDGQLYLLDRGSNRPLKLLPFFKFMASPQSEHNACYFYNRIEEDGQVRSLSYHFEEEHDMVTSSPEVVNLLSEIMQGEG